MIIELQGKYSDISLSVNYNGALEISIDNNVNVFNSILDAIYAEMNTEDFIKTLDYDQMKEISDYFETIKENRWGR